MIDFATGTDINFVSIYFITIDVPFTTRVIFAVLRTFDCANELPEVRISSDLLSDCYESLPKEDKTVGNSEDFIVF